MKKLLQTRQIYENADLQEFIYELEFRYESIDLSHKYSNLVNFSDNMEVPFHKWFRYREGFSGKLIHELIKDSGAIKSEIIIDPFCGSGTTPVVALLEGYKGLGIDVNPLSAFIGNVKMQHYTLEEINKCKIISQNLLRNFRGNEDKYNCLQKYFEMDNFTALCSIKSYIDTIQDSRIYDLLLTAFLCIVEASSNRWRDGNGLKTVHTKVTDVFSIYINKLSDILNDIESTSDRLLGEGMCIADTATNLHSICDEHYFSKNLKVGTIIFSPPYPNSFDYFESYKLELVFGGFAENIRDINNFRQQAVRSFISAKPQQDCDKHVELIVTEIEQAIPKKEAETGKKDFRTRKVPNMIKGYFSDMQEIIKQCGLCLEKGRKMYIVVDQSAYVGVIVPTDLLLAYLAEQVGFEVTGIIECRKARTSTQQLRRHPYLKNGLRESIVELVKKQN